MKKLLILVAFLTLAVPAFSAEPDELLADPVLEARAKEIDAQLRCVVCQSQSIAESNAPLAKDLRILVRERLTDGDSDEQAIQYIVDRYGDYVLMKPPLQGNTLALWFFPAFALLMAGGVAFFYLRSFKSRGATESEALSEDDEADLQRIIKERAE